MSRRAFSLLLISLAAIAVRCWRIGEPFDDHWSWRQSDVAAIARNYFENGFHFGHPQIDWAGDGPGFVGTEFPILPFAVAIAYKFLGVHEWIGRLESILFFAISLPFFFAIVRRAGGGTAAIIALIFYSFAPLSIAASRAFMPDMPSLTLALAGFYFFWRWIDLSASGARASCLPASASLPAPLGSAGSRTKTGWKPVLPCRDSADVVAAAVTGGRKKHNSAAGDGGLYRCGGSNLMIAAVMIALSLLIKPTMTTIAAPLAALAYRRFGVSAFRRVELWAFGVIALVPPAIWYWHAHEIAQQFYPHHFFGAGGARLMNFAWYWRIFVLTFTSSLTPILFLLAAIGVGVSVAAAVTGGRMPPIAGWKPTLPIAATTTAPDIAPFQWWLAAMIVFIIVVGYGNRHQWYQLPLVPIAAAFGGAALSKLAWRRNTVIASGMILFFASSIFFARHFFAPAAKSLWELGRTLKERTPAEARIIAADGGNPTALYYAHRKGWHFLERDGIYDGNPLDSAQIIAGLEKLRSRGATHLVFYDGTIWWLQYYPEFTQYLARTSRLVSASVDYRIYELKK